jgi:hypothetical protein
MNKDYQPRRKRWLSPRFQTPMQVDSKRGEILNGFSNLPYLPKDPVRRANLLRNLGITEDDLITLEDCR